jgi:multisubunit Na+/H+ antiporter MnhB subunit
MDRRSGSMLNWLARQGGAEGGIMLQAFFMRRAMSMISAALGGFGVFCVVYSFSTPHIAAQALVLLGAALALSYFSGRE